MMDMERNTITYISIEDLEEHPDNPRTFLGDLDELAESIKRSGILQNLTVVPSPEHPGKFRIVIGHRRFAAAKMAGLKELPCAVDIRMEYADQLATMLAENVQRSNLTLSDEVWGIQTMMDLGLGEKEIAEKTGISASKIHKRARLRNLNADKLDKAEKRGATIGDLMKAAAIKDEQLREQVLEAAGTPNFANELMKAKAHERTREMCEILIPRLREFAEEITPDTNRMTMHIWQYFTADSFNSLEEVKKPEDGHKYAFEIFGGHVTVFEVKETEKETEYDRMQRYRSMKREAENEVAVRFQQMRDDFVYGMKKVTPEAAAAMAIMVITCNAYAYSTDARLLRSVTRTDTENTEKELTQTDFETIMADPLTVAFRVAYALYRMMIPADMTCGCMVSYSGEYQRNKRIIRLYEVLKRIGYEVSDEEESWLNGTHPCYKDPE